ncbi:MAG: hypothetical protein AAGJ83_10595, partial [Planctomycetota bacterium]
PFDTTLTSLIDGSSAHSSQWFETVSGGSTEILASRLASLSMNADFRCVRCHDSLVGRAGSQNDYWSFVALLNERIRRDGGKWEVSAEQGSGKPTFYELPDGRQRMATAGVPESILPSDESRVTFDQWTSTLRGSQALADGLVQMLWEMVHGRTLLPSPVDALAAPSDEALNRLHQQLSDDLRASEFDIARTLAAIISSPMTRRSVPETLRGENVVSVDESVLRQGMELVAAFAAASHSPDSNYRQRIDVALGRVGGRLSEGPQMILAQPLPSGERPSVKTTRRPLTFQQRLEMDFPGDNAPLPVSWLRSIDGFDEQLRHLAYMADVNQVPAEIRDVAESLRRSSTDESAIHRLWWILQQ